MLPLSEPQSSTVCHQGENSFAAALTRLWWESQLLSVEKALWTSAPVWKWKLRWVSFNWSSAMGRAHRKPGKELGMWKNIPCGSKELGITPRNRDLCNQGSLYSVLQELSGWRHWKRAEGMGLQLFSRRGSILMWKRMRGKKPLVKLRAWEWLLGYAFSRSKRKWWLYCGYFFGSLFYYMIFDRSIDWLMVFYFNIWFENTGVHRNLTEKPAFFHHNFSALVGQLGVFFLIIIFLPMRVEGDNGNQYSEFLSVKTSQWSHVITSPFSSLLEFFAKTGAVTLFNTCIFNNQSSAITFLGYPIELSNSNFLLEDRLLNNVVYIQSFNIS